jgi:acyl CoA:acetate/3-ketoacid CoA transferase beta subunit
MTDYNPMELMLCAASKILEDNSVVIVGTGAPCAAAMLAQRTHADHMTILFEAGGTGPQLPSMPISVGDSRTFHRGLWATTMDNIMAMLQRGAVDTCFIGGAQIDMFGNINSTVIGPHQKPKVRFPGSGGANDLASLCWRSICMTVHSPKRFVEKIDFMTTPGFLKGKNSREKAGLPPGTGPYKVITNLCIMGYHPKKRRMQVESIHPGIEKDEIIRNTGFKLLWADSVEETAAPTSEELRVLREEVDPHKYVIGRAVQ